MMNNNHKYNDTRHGLRHHEAERQPELAAQRSAYQQPGAAQSHNPYQAAPVSAEPAEHYQPHYAAPAYTGQQAYQEPPTMPDAGFYDAESSPYTAVNYPSERTYVASPAYQSPQSSAANLGSAKTAPVAPETVFYGVEQPAPDWSGYAANQTSSPQAAPYSPEPYTQPNYSIPQTQPSPSGTTYLNGTAMPPEAPLPKTASFRHVDNSSLHRQHYQPAYQQSSAAPPPPVYQAPPPPEPEQQPAPNNDASPAFNPQEWAASVLSQAISLDWQAAKPQPWDATEYPSESQDPANAEYQQQHFAPEAPFAGPSLASAEAAAPSLASQVLSASTAADAAYNQEQYRAAEAAALLNGQASFNINHSIEEEMEAQNSPLKVSLLTHTPDPERVVAAAARLCYSPKSGSELLENFTDDKVQSFLARLSDLGHFSPFEHAVFTFAIDGVSRSLSHQLVRHRMASYSQKSQRYVDETGFSYIVPPSIQNNSSANQAFGSLMQHIEQFYKDLVAAGIPAEDARAVLPNAATTNLVVTMNARSLYNFFQLRCCHRAQDEIRHLANQMLGQVKRVAPNLFAAAGATCLTDGYCPEGEMTCGLLERINRQ